jgi:dihydropteroate synthase
VYDRSVDSTDVIVAGSRRELQRLSKTLKLRNANTARIASSLDFLLNADSSKITTFLCRQKRLHIGGRTISMGVLAAGPDESGKSLFKKAEQIIADGADIIELTRSTSFESGLSPSEFKEIIDMIKGKSNIPICTDVSTAEEAREMLEAGADIINDSESGRDDPGVVKAAAKFNAGIVIMHTGEIHRGGDIIGEIMAQFRKRIKLCQDSGIGINSIIADPGLGFGKTIGQNLAIIRKLREIKSLGVPLMVGPSGKGLYTKYGVPEINEDPEVISSVVAVSIINGADITRVHDVKRIKNAARIIDAVVKP